MHARNLTVRRSLGTLLAMVAATLLGGCLGTAMIHRQRAIDFSEAQSKREIDQLEGIPFYVKAPYCRTTETTELVWVDVSVSEYLEVTGAEPRLLGALTVPAVSGGSEKLSALRAAVLEANRGSSNGVIEALKNLAADSDSRVQTEGKPDFDGRCTSRAVEVLARTDYTHVYFLNGRMPWFGSSTVNGKLAPDGTLSEGSASAESTAGELLTEFLPVKEALSAKWVPGVAESAAAADELKALAGELDLEVDRDFGKRSKGAVEERLRAALDASLATRIHRIDIVPHGYTWKRVREWKQDPDDVSCSKPQNPLESVLRSPIPESPAPDPSAEDRTATINGTVTLPPSKE